MAYCVRLMSKEDVAQVTNIDREAFPTQWPPPNYEHELRNQLAHYFVVCDEEKAIDNAELKTSPKRGLARLTASLRQFLNGASISSKELPATKGDYVLGFVGLWIIVDEAHITAIAVREACRRQGLGELLIISAIDLAAKLRARGVTLEVRASNTTAQQLYTKYDFRQLGIRRGYYTDNREDALILAIENITLTSFQTHFQQLKQAYFEKWGTARAQIPR